MMRPARISTIRSAIRIASSGSWVTTMVVAPVSLQNRDRLVAHGVPHPPVEIGKRLVHQQHARARRDGARQRDPLLLAARKRVRIFIRVALQSDPRERPPGSDRGLVGGQAGAGRTSRSAARSYAETARNPETSGRCRDAPARRSPPARWPADRRCRTRPGTRRLDARGDAQESRLAAAGMAEQADELAGRDRQGHVVEHGRLAEGLDDMLEGRAGPGSTRPPCRAGPSAAGETGPFRLSPGTGSVIRRRPPEHDGLEEIVLIERVLVLAQACCRRTGPGTERSERHAAFEEARAL